MKAIKVADTTPLQIDWLVAKCEGILDPVHGEPQPRVVFYSDQWDRYMRLNPPPQVYYSDRYEPSTSWAQGGPIIEREGISVGHQGHLGVPLDSLWYATDRVEACGFGQTPLIAALRCYVASKLGDTAEVPDELVPAL